MASGRREGKNVVHDNKCLDTTTAGHEASVTDAADTSVMQNRAEAKEFPNPEGEKHEQPVFQSVTNVLSSSGGGRHEL